MFPLIWMLRNFFQNLSSLSFYYYYYYYYYYYKYNVKPQKPNELQNARKWRIYTRGKRKCERDKSGMKINFQEMLVGIMNFEYQGENRSRLILQLDYI
jgi:hypothetical protein